MESANPLRQGGGRGQGEILPLADAPQTTQDKKEKKGTHTTRRQRGTTNAPSVQSRPPGVRRKLVGSRGAGPNRGSAARLGSARRDATRWQATVSRTNVYDYL